MLRDFLLTEPGMNWPTAVKIIILLTIIVVGLMIVTGQPLLPMF